MSLYIILSLTISPEVGYSFFLLLQWHILLFCVNIFSFPAFSRHTICLVAYFWTPNVSWVAQILPNTNHIQPFLFLLLKFSQFLFGNLIFVGRGSRKIPNYFFVMVAHSQLKSHWNRVLTTIMVVQTAIICSPFSSKNV